MCIRDSLNTAYNQVTRTALISMKGFTNIKNTYNNAKETISNTEIVEKNIQKESVEIKVENIAINSSKQVLTSAITKYGLSLIHI